MLDYVRIVQVERQICLQSHNIKHIQKLNIQYTGIKLNELARSVRKKLCHNFLNYWNKKPKEPEGKFDTYFKIKKCFSRGNIFIY